MNANTTHTHNNGPRASAATLILSRRTRRLFICGTIEHDLALFCALKKKSVGGEYLISLSPFWCIAEPLRTPPRLPYFLTSEARCSGRVHSLAYLLGARH
jgi:hypothetical protein